MPNDAETWRTLVRTVWGGPPAALPGPRVLRAALELARRNDADGPFIRAHADRLPEETAALDRAVHAYRQNLGIACRLLAAAGVVPILIKATPWDDLTYSNFDLVVGDDGWEASVAALAPWVVRTSRYPLERATKLLLYPPSGPAVHLHRSVAWFDVPAIGTAALRSRAVRAADEACLLPHPIDALRIQLAHAVFQNQALSLGELLAIRPLLVPAILGSSRVAAVREGWVRGYDEATRTALDAVERLERLEPFPLPARLPVGGALAAGVEHAVHLARSGRPLVALRELALRGPLVAAKQRRLRLA